MKYLIREISKQFLFIYHFSPGKKKKRLLNLTNLCYLATIFSAALWNTSFQVSSINTAWAQHKKKSLTQLPLVFSQVWVLTRALLHGALCLVWPVCATELILKPDRRTFPSWWYKPPPHTNTATAALQSFALMLLPHELSPLSKAVRRARFSFIQGQYERAFFYLRIK